jgi:hypothetical protein
MYEMYSVTPSSSLMQQGSWLQDLYLTLALLTRMKCSRSQEFKSHSTYAESAANVCLK